MGWIRDPWMWILGFRLVGTDHERRLAETFEFEYRREMERSGSGCPEHKPVPTAYVRRYPEGGYRVTPRLVCIILDSGDPDSYRID
ncbi:unnamed protein product [Danaus chrysippus]|uniref:(African queen) hypothetical protein n=1 Tax=Danaus chrysippus TaxID=151541 RepID=A0A8J2W725_9NEOP|nr:unnamed protein product [Danaus chrysippus]